MGAKRSRDDRKDRAAALKAAQAAKDRRQRRIVYGTAIPIVLIIIGLVPFNSWYQAHQRGKQHAVGYVRSASSAAKAASCTGVRNDREMTTSLVSATTTVDYAALTAKAGQGLPPTSGPREANLLPDTPQFYAVKAAPRPERAVGNLDHGYIVVWYDSKLPAADVKILQGAVASNSRTLVVPWTRSVFPGNQHVVLTAWDRTQRCTKASAAVMSDFANAYRDPDLSGRGWGSPTAPTPLVATSTAPTVLPTVVPTATISGAATSTPTTSETAPATAAPSATAAATPAPVPSTAAPTSPAATPTFPHVTVTPIR